MNSQQFNQAIHNVIAAGFQEGVGKGKMTSLDVAGILATHTANTLLVIQDANAKIAAAHKVANEIVLPINFKRNDIDTPSEGLE